MRGKKNLFFEKPANVITKNYTHSNVERAEHAILLYLLQLDTARQIAATQQHKRTNTTKQTGT